MLHVDVNVVGRSLRKISGFSIDGGIGMPFSGCFTWGGYLFTT